MQFHASVPISTTLILFPTAVEDRLRRCFLPFAVAFKGFLFFLLKHRKETDVTRATRLDDKAEPQHPVVTLGLPGRDWHVFVDQV